MKPFVCAVCAAALVAAVSCTKQEMPDTPRDGKIWMEFHAGNSTLTRTQLLEDNKVHWEAGDAISVFDPSGQNNEFATEQSGESVTFTGAVSQEGQYYALYPHSADASIAGSLISATLPSVQTAFNGSFGSSLNPSVALADADNNLNFRNVCALVKFTLGGSANVAKASLSGNGGETLAGPMTIDASSDSPSAVAESDFGETVVELSGEIAAGKVYYFVVFPGTLSEGLTLSLYDSDGKVWRKRGTSEAELVAGKILDLGEISPDTFSPESGYEIVDDTYHIYNAEGLTAWADNSAVLGKNVVLEDDIDLKGLSWTPVGGSLSDGYAGDFDGNGKFIYNLNVSVTDGNAGFFGGIAAGGKVHDVKFSGATVTSSGSGSYVGVVAGSSLGIIEDCNVRGSEVQGHYSGAVTGDNSVQVNRCNALDMTVTADYSAGGIAGANYGKIEYCTLSGNSTITASGTSSRAGGIVGGTSEESGITTSGRLLKCAVDGATISGSWAGGIAGENSFGIVAQCVVNRTVVTHASTDKSTRLGGVVGYNGRGDVVASYSAYSQIGGDGLSSEVLGGIVGYNYNSAACVYGCYSTHVSLLGDVTGSNSGKGCIAGYTSGHVTSCYAVLPDGVTGIGLVGSATSSDVIDHCVDPGETNYGNLTDNVAVLKADDGSVWEAAKIWNFTASGAAPLINSNYICDPPSSGN